MDGMRLSLFFLSDIGASSIKLYRCDDTARFVNTDGILAHQPGAELVLEFKLQDYDLSQILPHIETFFDREMEVFAK